MCDFGDNFEVADHDGIEPSEFLIGHITKVISHFLKRNRCYNRDFVHFLDECENI